jgi:hypothetical protein
MIKLIRKFSHSCHNLGFVLSVLTLASYYDIYIPGTALERCTSFLKRHSTQSLAIHFHYFITNMDAAIPGQM